jgi:ABC-type multidrug transport system fused ATPase/permease subunit
LRIVTHIDGFISALAPILREITAYGRMENFIENAKIENARSKRLKIVEQDQPNYAVWLKQCTLYLNTTQLLKKCSLRIAKGNRAIIWGAHGTGKHILVKLIMCVYMLEDNSEETESEFHFEEEDGQACILGYDVTKVNLRELRARISYLDGGMTSFYRSTIREVIDPLVKYTDEDIMELIDYFNLMDTVEGFLKSEKSKKNFKSLAELKQLEKMASVDKKIVSDSFETEFYSQI